jgi:hypothetical protein
MVGFCKVDENPLGPVQLYVAVPTTVRFKFCPEHKGELLPGEGIPGIAFTVTLITPAGLVQPATVVVTEYPPVATDEAPVIVGFCNADVNPLGPVHEKVPPPGSAVKPRFCPAHIGALLLGTGADGVELTTTEIVPIGLEHPAAVINNVYVPVASVETPVMVGFCTDDVKPFGPVQL